MEKVECLIIGSGPAGYTAAIYAARADMKPVMYEGLQPGGQLTITTEVENYPGFPHGIQGPEMMNQFKEQAVRLGTDVRFGMVTSVEFKQGGPQKVIVDGSHEIEAQAVIISTGASAKWLGIPSEQRLNGSGVSACAVCDGFFYRRVPRSNPSPKTNSSEQVLPAPEGEYISGIAKTYFDLPLREARDLFEKAYFEHQMQIMGGSMTKISDYTGLERTHLYRKLKALGIDTSRNKGEQ